MTAAVIFDETANRAELVPAAMFAENRVYTVDISTAPADLAGNTLAAAVSFSFTTAAAAPNVVSTTPADQAMNVARDVQVRFTFDKPIDTATLMGNVTLAETTGAAVPATVAWEGSTLTATLAGCAAAGDAGDARE
ncbi:MAG: Ig-like domain-containing protein [Myxococcaceae bacterium]|nr:Ig-like domain-containing protein [Myxococcaceae bacterium]